MEKDSYPSRKDVKNMVEEFVKNNPGSTADYVISQLAPRLEVNPKVIRKCLRELGSFRKIYARGMRLYHRDYLQGQGIEGSENNHEEFGEHAYTDNVVAGEPISDNYIISWDLKLKDMPKAEARKLYRRLDKAYGDLVREGKVEKIQRSLWKVIGEENLEKILQVFPEEKAVICIFKICGERRIG